MPSLTPKRVLRESGSLGLVLLPWGVVALVVGTDSTLTTGSHVAGLIMAGLYAILRGRALAPEADTVYEQTDPGSILRDNARALLPALTWFGPRSCWTFSGVSSPSSSSSAPAS
jgi:hypothetical protein